jgi:hypothetical protein
LWVYLWERYQNMLWWWSDHGFNHLIMLFQVKTNYKNENLSKILIFYHSFWCFEKHAICITCFNWYIVFTQKLDKIAVWGKNNKMSIIFSCKLTIRDIRANIYNIESLVSSIKKYEMSCTKNNFTMNVISMMKHVFSLLLY